MTIDRSTSSGNDRSTSSGNLLVGACIDYGWACVGYYLANSQP